MGSGGSPGTPISMRMYLRPVAASTLLATLTISRMLALAKLARWREFLALSTMSRGMGVLFIFLRPPGRRVGVR